MVHEKSFFRKRAVYFGAINSAIQGFFILVLKAFKMPLHGIKLRETFLGFSDKTINLTRHIFQWINDVTKAQAITKNLIREFMLTMRVKKYFN